MNDTTTPPTQAATTLRPFQNADAQAVAELVTQSVKGHWTYQPEWFKESSDPKKRRLVAVKDGQVIATAYLSPFGDSAPDALRLDVSGDGQTFTPLYLHLLAEIPAGFTRLLGVCREDFTPQMTFFAAAGFRNAYQSWGAHLDLMGWNFETFRALDEKLFLQGYEVQRWDMHAPAAEWDTLYALHGQGEQDVPRNPTTTPAPLSRAELQRVMTQEEAVFVMRFKGELVALTRLTLPNSKAWQDAYEVSSDLTTTHPAHRSKGLATLLKAHALAWAKQAGYTHADTGGTVLNLPMLRVNTRLGYVTERMWVTWERKLDEKPLP